LIGWGISSGFVRHAGLPLLFLLFHTFGISAATGVPRLDPDYGATVDQWWAGYPFNPESSHYQPEIKSPSPFRELKPGDSIQEAIDSLPASGGTVKLAKGTYAGFQIVGRSHVHIVADEGATVLGRCRVASSREAMDYGTYDRHVSRRGQRLPHYWELHKKPTRDYYFRNLTFDGENEATSAIGLQRVYDVVFDQCTFQNYVNPKKGHPGLVWGHEGLNNIWCRDCRFLGECVYASYLDGCHGSGMIRCTVELSRFNSGGFLYLTNDDFTEDINENGRTDREEERTAKYIVIYKCTFNGNNHSAVQVTGENILVTQCEAKGRLGYFVGSDPRWADSDHKLAYRFHEFHLINNRVGQCREALMLSRNLAPVSCPPDVLVPRMGRATIRGNVVEDCPRLLKEITLPHPDFRKEGAKTATFEGPNVLENNTVAGKLIVKGELP
jgi:hypothetical protein